MQDKLIVRWLEPSGRIVKDKIEHEYVDGEVLAFVSGDYTKAVIRRGKRMQAVRLDLLEIVDAG